MAKWNVLWSKNSGDPKECKMRMTRVAGLVFVVRRRKKSASGSSERQGPNKELQQQGQKQA